MKKIILFFVILILIVSTVSATRTACLTGTDATIKSLLEALGMVVTTSCTSGFSGYNIVIDESERSDVRAAAVPAVLVSSLPDLNWKFSDAGDSAASTTMNDGSNPDSIDDGVGANPTIYSSSDTLYWLDQSGAGADASSAVDDNDAYYHPGESAKQITTFWWDDSDTDYDSASYTQKGVFLGFPATAKWTDQAKRIFNNSVSYACPYCADECIPPGSGNWEINSTCNINNKDYNVTGNVSVFDNGLLNLTGSGGYLNFIGTNRFIFIYPGGELSLDISATIGKWPPS